MMSASKDSCFFRDDPKQYQELFGKPFESKSPFSIRRAPSLPILALADNEGNVRLIDIRDGQVCQIIDTTAGRAPDTQGLCFTTEGALAVLTKYAFVNFYASAIPGAIPSGAFLDSEEDDQEWFEAE